ncbi:MAG: hypothetical protein ACUVQY_11255, partial [Thermoproteota archaeon]
GMKVRLFEQIEIAGKWHLHNAHHGLNYPSIYCKLVPTMIRRALQLIAEDMEINDIYYFMSESFKQLVESKLKDGEFYDFF